jgi:hypothetical protein
MTRSTFVKKARKAIYTFGKRVEYPGKKGTKREGRMISKTDHTLPKDSKDPVLIERGESYYWWQFKNGPVQYSKARPKRSQLTQSEFNGWLYDFQDDTIGALSIPEGEDLKSYSSDDLSAIRDEWVQEIESQRDELQDKLSNMPESLQEGSASGQLLQERIDGLESWSSDLEGVDIDWDDEELRQEAEDEWESLHTQALKDADPDVEAGKEEWVDEKFLELKWNKIEEIISDLQSQDPGL